MAVPASLLEQQSAALDALSERLKASPSAEDALKAITAELVETTKRLYEAVRVTQEVEVLAKLDRLVAGNEGYAEGYRSAGVELGAGILAPPAEEKYLVPCALWSNDCQGKKDFDGHLLSISCRYWPGKNQPGGFMAVDTDRGEIKNVPYGDRPHVHASIKFRYGTPEEPDGYSDYAVWREASIDGDTEEEVKSKTEVWVKDRMKELVGLLGEFYDTH